MRTQVINLTVGDISQRNAWCTKALYGIYCQNILSTLTFPITYERYTWLYAFDMNQRLDWGDSTIGWEALFVVFCIILSYGCEFFYFVIMTYKKE